MNKSNSHLHLKRHILNLQPTQSGFQCLYNLEKITLEENCPDKTIEVLKTAILSVFQMDAKLQSGCVITEIVHMISLTRSSTC